VTDRQLRATIGLLALAGTALAAYLVFVHYSGRPVTCSFGGCETVHRSKYSEVLGVPVALLGLGAYVAILALSLWCSEAARAAGLAIALSGVLFGAYLLYAQVVVIEALCEWCLLSDALLSVIAALSLLRLLTKGAPAPPGVPARART
jgi:uncharacterized membrane protein